MAKDETSGPGGSVAPVEKHFVMHGIYGLQPTSAGAMQPSPQAQRSMKHSNCRDEPSQEDQDFLSASHCTFLQTLLTHTEGN